MTKLRDYIAFSGFREKLLEKSGIQARGYQILEFIADKQDHQGLCTVTELINRRKIGSPAIIHAALKKLIKDGYVRIELNQEDHRIKYPVLTDKADKLFAELLKEFSKYVGKKIGS